MIEKSQRLAKAENRIIVGQFAEKTPVFVVLGINEFADFLDDVQVPWALHQALAVW
jgi:hypothetical protein